jgi:hypothetical protein
MSFVKTYKSVNPYNKNNFTFADQDTGWLPGESGFDSEQEQRHQHVQGLEDPTIFFP